MKPPENDYLIMGCEVRRCICSFSIENYGKKPFVKAGLFGPGTLAWDVSREAALFLGAGRAALLQLAHPHVAQAVADHSVTQRDPLARFRATFRLIFRMTLGDLEEAMVALVGLVRDDR